MSVDLSDSRKKIDAIDRNLLELLNERMRVSRDIVLKKRETGLPVFDAGREDALLAKLSEANPGPLSPDGIRRIWMSIMGESRIHQALAADSAKDKP
jgi:chorismate mutase